MRRLVLVMLVLGISCELFGREKSAHPDPQFRRVAPTWLHRYVPEVPVKAVDLSAPGCDYRPIFGDGDSDSGIIQSVARFGQVALDPKGACKEVSYPREEQIYYVLDGSGVVDYNGRSIPIEKDGFIYIPPGVRHRMSNTSGAKCRFVIMGFKIPQGVKVSIPAKPQIAKAQDVSEHTDTGHPKSVLYRLLLGSRQGRNDKIESGITVTSLFLMDFAPGGTNFPHRHEIAEEIYLVLDGHGMMVAGGGTNGVEGLHPAKAGDAYFFRPNCTVGFYNNKDDKAHVLAVRSWVPIPERDYQN